MSNSTSGSLASRIQRAKALLPLRQLIAQLDDWDEGVCANLCPFHEDLNPSFSIFTYHGQELWKCHAGCGAGDQITYIEIKLEMSRGQAIGEFLRMAGVRRTDGRAGRCL